MDTWIANGLVASLFVLVAAGCYRIGWTMWPRGGWHRLVGGVSYVLMVLLLYSALVAFIP